MFYRPVVAFALAKKVNCIFFYCLSQYFVISNDDYLAILCYLVAIVLPLFSFNGVVFVSSLFSSSLYVHVNCNLSGQCKRKIPSILLFNALTVCFHLFTPSFLMHYHVRYSVQMCYIFCAFLSFFFNAHLIFNHVVFITGVSVYKPNYFILIILMLFILNVIY